MATTPEWGALKWANEYFNEIPENIIEEREINFQTIHRDFSVAEIFLNIKKHGHNLIDAGKYDWSSEVSEKTLSALKLSDLKKPFQSGTVLYGDYKIHFFFRNENWIVVQYSHPSLNYTDKRGKFHTEYEGLEMWHTAEFGTIGGDLDIGENKEERSLMYALFSILLYLSVFKNNRERVSAPKTISAKKSGKTEKHSINIVYLSQSNAYDTVGSASPTQKKSDKTWIVRGHWRNQYYKEVEGTKPKWIDPYWKGSGKVEVEKIYKL